MVTRSDHLDLYGLAGLDTEGRQGQRGLEEGR